MIAGPNGSGKSTAIRKLLKPEWIGHYLNPDDMQKEIEATGRFDLGPFGLRTTEDEVLAAFRDSSLLKGLGLTERAGEIVPQPDGLTFGSLATDERFPYFVSVLADFVRRKLIEARASFTFETVMSSRDKVELLAHAKDAGYRTYLYFVATGDAEINVERVRQRVQLDGHAVPEEKVRQRYGRSLENLADAIRAADRSFIFDNSGRESVFLAEVGASPEGKTISVATDDVPAWFARWVVAELAGAEPQ